ncbi:hypothetical protein [Nocardia callitridis]|uniref:Uncharacterized protein n=1 Tax=Nocardia callitridis TaxID=648753 RepID=A0ABP9KPM9_9NOCA
MKKSDRRIAIARSEEILNYFGKCQACGYPARAVTTTLVFDTGAVETTVVATCNLPCGWTGRVPLTTMTTEAFTAAS